MAKTKKKEPAASVSVLREDLIRILQSVEPGLSARGTVDQSTAFTFLDGTLCTYNEEVCCRASSPFGTAVNGAVRAGKILDVLGKMTEDEICVMQTPTELQFQCKRDVEGKSVTTRRIGVTCEHDVRLPVKDIPTPSDWKPLHKDFCEAISLVQESAKNTGIFMQTAVHIGPKWLEACDRHQLCRWTLKTGFSSSVLVRKESVRHVVGAAMTEFAESNHWVHFRNDSGLELCCRRFSENYEDFSKFLEVEGTPTSLPKSFIDESDIASLFSSENRQADRVLVDVRSGSSRLSARGVTGWYEGAWRRLNYEGPSFSFLISPKMLKSLVERHNECVLSENRLAVKDKRYTYVVYLTKPKDHLPAANGTPETEEPVPEESNDAGEE
jgi:hypothetical protein